MSQADYRMFVDEVGHADLGNANDPNGRYLSLTGVVFEVDYHDRTVTAWLDRLKDKHFGSLPNGRPIILHRKELVNKNWPFQALRNADVEREFNQDLMTCLEKLRYMVLTVTIDKLEHVNRYTVWRHHPYHYCLQVLVERYTLWLNRRDSSGDIFAESRGRRDDFQLKKAFRYIYNRGTDYMPREDIQRALVSEDLKVFRKKENLAGLQLADLIAHPSFRCMMARRSNEALPDNFGGKIAQILEYDKYDRNSSGKIWGCKWLP
ncbi:MAG TPA: DUF3800 domain-containing protein [Thermoanaerobaculia bacterium]